MNLIYALTAALSIATSVAAGLLGRQAIARMDHKRDIARRRR